MTEPLFESGTYLSSRSVGQPPAAPLTAFVGRSEALVFLRTAIAQRRLVCLTGPGGAGKTRLATALAERHEQASPGSICWVDLSPRVESGAMPRALADALGVREAPGRPLLDAVIAGIGDTARVLVLDSCEHLLPGCAAIIGKLLEQCPHLRVLATSREVLGVNGEVVWRVPPLSTPPAGDDVAWEAVLEYESVQLFVERAQIAQPGFTLDSSNAVPIARICRGLDGLPLAIELAAARVRVLSVVELAEGLQDRLALLTTASPSDERHRSLRAVLDWSHRMLTEAERRLLADLSVFTDSFGLDAARAVHRAVEPVEPVEPAGLVDLLARLVDRSLVTTVVEAGRTRYALSETVRLYAAEQLAAVGGTREVRRRLVRWCVSFAERAGAEIAGAQQADWLRRADAERANVANAVHLALTADGWPEDALRITAAMWRFWYLRGYYSEGRAWLESALAATAGTRVDPRVRARAMLGAGRLAYLQCSYVEASERLEEALAMYREQSDQPGTASVLNYLGSVARERGQYPAALALHTAGLQLWRDVGDAEGIARSNNYLSLLAWLGADPVEGTALAELALAQYRTIGHTDGIAWALINLGACAAYGDEPDQAGALLDESLTRSREAGYREGVAWSLDLLGVLALRNGDLTTAADRLRDSLREHWALGDRWRTPSVMEGLAAHFAAGGHADRAARVLGAARAMRASVGAPVPPVEQPAIGRTESLIDASGTAGSQRLGRLADAERVVIELTRHDDAAYRSR